MYLAPSDEITLVVFSDKGHQSSNTNWFSGAPDQSKPGRYLANEGQETGSTEIDHTVNSPPVAYVAAMFMEIVRRRTVM